MRYYESDRFIIDLADIILIDKGGITDYWSIYIYGANEPFQLSPQEGLQIAAAFKNYLEELEK